MLRRPGSLSGLFAFALALLTAADAVGGGCAIQLSGVKEAVA